VTATAHVGPVSEGTRNPLFGHSCTLGGILAYARAWVGAEHRRVEHLPLQQTTTAPNPPQARHAFRRKPSREALAPRFIAMRACTAHAGCSLVEAPIRDHAVRIECWVCPWVGAVTNWAWKVDQ
jgi:hypothetical protein